MKTSPAAAQTSTETWALFLTAHSILIGAMEKRLLSGADVGRLAAPGLERRLLDRARERERQRPWHAAAEAHVHRVEVGRCQLRRLPAGKKGDAGDGRGDDAQEAADGGVGDGLDARLLGGGLARQDHVRLEQHSFEKNVLRVELVEDDVQRRLGDFVAALERVVAVHQHFGLDDRHQSRLLAERRVARQCVRVGFDAACGGN